MHNHKTLPSTLLSFVIRTISLMNDAVVLKFSDVWIKTQIYYFTHIDDVTTERWQIDDKVGIKLMSG